MDNLNNTSGRSPLRLKFVIVGGGIAGLATAFTLQRAGHGVIVLEKLNEKAMSFGKTSGPIRSPPNMTRLLYRWGLGPVLKKKSIKCERLVGVNGNSGDMLSVVTLNEEFLQDPFTSMMILVQHADLRNMLRELALREGVEIRQNANVVQVDAGSVSVRLATGDIISGDIIVLADGCSSKLQSSVAGYPQDPPLKLKTGPRLLFVAFTVDISLLEDDESFRGLLEPTDWVKWIAEDTVVNTYVFKGLLIGSLTREYHGVSTEVDEEWSNARNLESYGLDLSNLEPRFRKMLRLSKTIVSRIILKRPMPEELIDESSTVVVVGEAAHPFACEGVHATALAIEDAETLGGLLSRVESRSEVSQLMTAYEDIRHPRCARMYRRHWDLDAAFKYPIGPQQHMRDSVLRRTLVHRDWDVFDESGFQTTVGEHLTSFAYDATEAVEDWRTTRVKNTRFRGSPLQVWITQE